MKQGLDFLPSVKRAVRKVVGGYRGFEPKRQVKGVLWPHGEFTVSWPYESVEPYRKADENEFWDTLGLVSDNSPPPLLDSRPESSQGPSCPWPFRPKRKYGKHGITSLGRKMVQSGVHLMAERFGQKNLTFGTLTVPELRHHERIRLAEGWGEVLRQLIQWITRRLEKAGLPKQVVSVSEIQPKRLRRTGEGYLHLHLVWPNSDVKRQKWSVDVVELRAFWESLLCRIAAVSTVPTTQIRLEAVESNVAGYLSKYMSKGGEGLAEFEQDCGNSGIPGQWWNMSKACRDATKRAVLRGHKLGVVLESWVDGVWSGDITVWPGGLHVLSKEVFGRPCTIAYYGYLTEYAMTQLREREL